MRSFSEIIPYPQFLRDRFNASLLGLRAKQLTKKILSRITNHYDYLTMAVTITITIMILLHCCIAIVLHPLLLYYYIPIFTIPITPAPPPTTTATWTRTRTRATTSTTATTTGSEQNNSTTSVSTETYVQEDPLLFGASGDSKKRPPTYLKRVALNVDAMRHYKDQRYYHLHLLTGRS